MNRLHQAKYFLKAVTVNVGTMRGKKGKLSHLLDVVDPDVICIQETQMRHELVLRNYKERESTVPGNGNRGTKLMVRKSLATTPVDCGAWASQGMELTGVDIHLPGEQPRRLFNTYMSHHIPDQRASVTKLVGALRSTDRALSLGDNNAKMDVPQHLNTNRLGDILDEFIEDEQIGVIMSQDYTRYDPSGRAPSTIDFGITSFENRNMVSTVTVLPDIGSDHRPVLFEIPLENNPLPPTITRKPNFKKADWEKFQSFALAKLREAPPIVHTKESLIRAAKFLKELVIDADRESIPRVRIKHGPRKRELPPYIVDLIHTRRNLVNQKYKRGRADLNPEIRRLGRIIEDEIETFEYNKFRDEWEDCQQKDRYGYFKLAGRILKTGVSSTTYPIKDKNGDLLPDTQTKLDEFGRLYKDIYTPPPETEESRVKTRDADRFCKKLTDEFSEVRRRPRSRMLDQTVTPEKIRKALQHTKNTAPGEDGVYYTHIKNLPDPVLVYLAQLYQTCWECSYFPEVWKNAIVTLIPKTGKDHTLPKNYRPISLLSALGKVFERLINSELVAHIESNNLLPECQAGFRPKRSTQDQLLKFAQDAAVAKSRGRVLMATFFDVEKAFDKVWHQAFLLKLGRLGFDRVTIGLIQSYLTGRTIQIKINGVTGPKIPLKAGTPQGAILSPTLFNLYVSDIPQPNKQEGRLSQFADDIGTWASGTDGFGARNKLQHYNNRLMKWCKTWRVVLAPAKTQVITISNKGQEDRHGHAMYQVIDGHRVHSSPTAEFLGVVFDSRLSMNNHANKILTGLRRRVGLFKRITGSCVRPMANTEISMKILHSMIVSQATYAPVATCLMTQSACNAIDQSLRKGGRMAIHAPSQVRNEYVEEAARLPPIMSTIKKLGQNYITNPARSQSIRELVVNFNQIPHQVTNTPLHKLL